MADAEMLIMLPDGTVVDGSTGEIVEEGSEIAAIPDVGDRARWLATQYELAQRQVKGWEDRRLGVRIVLEKLAPERKFETDAIRVTMIGKTTIETAKAEDVKRANDLELVTANEAAEILLRAAKGSIDVPEVKAWIAEQPPERQGVLTKALIGSYERAGYPLIKPVLRDALGGK